VNQGNIVEFVGEKFDVTKNLDFLLKSYGRGEIAGFNGSFITYDIDYNYLSSAVFKNGKKISAKTEIINVDRDGLQLELKKNDGVKIQLNKQASVSKMSYLGCPVVYPVWWGPPLYEIGEDCIVSVTVVTTYDSDGCVISQDYNYNGHTCPSDETADESGSGESGSGSGDGGDEPPYGGGGETPCQKAKNLAQKLNNMLAQTAVQERLTSLQDLHSNSPIEHGFAVIKTATGYEATQIISGTYNSVTFTGLGDNVVFIVHTHPESTGSAIHSSTDIYQLNDFRNSPDFLGSIVVRGDDMHVLSITDAAQYDAFLQKSDQKGWYDQNSKNGWMKKTSIYKGYEGFIRNIREVYQGDLTYATQLYIMEQYKMGVTLQEWKNGGFVSRKADVGYNNGTGSSTPIGGKWNIINSPYSGVTIEVKCN
jgi:hypothetical protein